MKKIALFIITSLVLCLALAGCGNSDTSAQPTATPSATASSGTVPTYGKVQIEMEDGGIIVIGLCPQYAPGTVENFVNLVKSGFYDGLTFHRVVKDFMIQGGDPEGTGMGGSQQTIKGEFASNGFTQNKLAHSRGVISMARSDDNDSASSQFFIMHKTTPGLNGSYAAFGKVLEGMDVVDKIAESETVESMSGEASSPVEPIVMKKVTVIEEVNYTE